MRNAVIYVHHEPIAHLFLTYGISASDMLSSTNKIPRHLLVLPPVDEQEFIDPHTGFNEISGEAQVTEFLRGKDGQTRPWLDYTHARYLQELTPTEISELLYLGHAKTHLQSPFYYKLQNNMVYLPLRNQMVNMYIRHEQMFERLLAAAITKYMRVVANEQPFWLRLRQQHFSPLDPAAYQALLPLLEDGLILDFRQVRFSGEQIKIPLMMPQDRFVPDSPEITSEAVSEGTLVLDRTTDHWHVA